MSAKRPAELAGAWYPDTAGDCERMFDRFESERRAASRADLRAGIVPHAGWVFSGSIAYNVLAELAERGRDAETLVLFAGHLGPASPITVMVRGACGTPFGELDTDSELAKVLLNSPALIGANVQPEEPTRHGQDNSTEVVLPLLKFFFPQARVLLVGAPPRAETLVLADALLAAAAGLGRSLLFVGSTDLTHYGPNYRFTPKGSGAEAERWVREVNDRRFLDRASTGPPGALIDEGLTQKNACCPGSAAAAIHCAKTLGAGQGVELRYATSADVRPASSFVGYGGLVF